MSYVLLTCIMLLACSSTSKKMSETELSSDKVTLDVGTSVKNVNSVEENHSTDTVREDDRSVIGSKDSVSASSMNYDSKRENDGKRYVKLDSLISAHASGVTKIYGLEASALERYIENNVLKDDNVNIFNAAVGERVTSGVSETLSSATLESNETSELNNRSETQSSIDIAAQVDEESEFNTRMMSWFWIVLPYALLLFLLIRYVYKNRFYIKGWLRMVINNYS